MNKQEQIKREEAARVIQYEWRYYIFFNYDVCGECGYGGKSIGCGCGRKDAHSKIYDPYFDSLDEV